MSALPVQHGEPLEIKVLYVEDDRTSTILFEAMIDGGELIDKRRYRETLLRPYRDVLTALGRDEIVTPAHGREGASSVEREPFRV